MTAQHHLDADLSALLHLALLCLALSLYPDFGMAAPLPEGRSHVSHTRRGHRHLYQAPEAAEGRASYASDVYAWALLTAELCCGKPLPAVLERLAAAGGAATGAADALVASALPSACPSSLRTVLLHCAAADAAARPGLDEVIPLLHAVLHELSDGADERKEE